MKNAPRAVISGTGSGCGKTTVVCALLTALAERKEKIFSFKCGPDYIDPMFHSEVIGAPSCNIDLFFQKEEEARETFVKYAEDLNVIEGAMGYYDGLSMEKDTASCYHAAKVLDAPVLLVVNGRGMALSLAAMIRGYLQFRSPSRIAGVILNHVTAMTYPRLKAVIEQECGVKVYGFFPRNEEFSLESRHLGLVTAKEVGNLKEKLHKMALQAEKSLEIDEIIRLMQMQSPLPDIKESKKTEQTIPVAVAMDEAFCFYYRENLSLLEELGAKIVPFSPLHDEKLPPCQGLYLGGGYPELYGEKLSQNKSMLSSVRENIKNGLPTIAECGGFMYLTDMIGEKPMTGAVHTDCFNTGKLSRFGYITLKAEKDGLLLHPGEEIRAHEFHYWDARDTGNAMTAVKPGGRSWPCVHSTKTLYAGFPHLYFRSFPKAIERFLKRCQERTENK